MQKVPIFMGSRLYIDFSNDSRFSKSLEEQIRDLRKPIPAMGEQNNTTNIVKKNLPEWLAAEVETAGANKAEEYLIKNENDIGAVISNLFLYRNLSLGDRRRTAAQNRFSSYGLRKIILMALAFISPLYIFQVIAESCVERSHEVDRRNQLHEMLPKAIFKSASKLGESATMDEIFQEIQGGKFIRNF